MTISLDHSLLEAALDGLTLQHERIVAQIAEIRRQLGSSGPARMPSSAAAPNSKRTMSAAGRRAIAEAQRKRWAAQKEEEAEVEPKQKRKLSAAGRRAIAEAARKRWAAARAAKAAK